MPSSVDLELIQEIEDLIKKYNKKPDKNITKKDIVVLLQNADIIVPGRSNLKGVNVVDEILEGVNFTPDIVKDGGKVRLLPVDTTKTEAVIMYNDNKYVIKKTPFTIGRENTNIEIPKTYISKIHVVISFKDGKYRIADYASTNGTKVNDTVLRPKVYYEIRDGYEIELADKEKMYIYIK